MNDRKGNKRHAKRQDHDREQSPTDVCSHSESPLMTQPPRRGRIDTATLGKCDIACDKREHARPSVASCTTIVDLLPLVMHYNAFRTASKLLICPVIWPIKWLFCLD